MKKNLFLYFIILYSFSVPIFVNQLKNFGNILINGVLILLLITNIYLNKKKISFQNIKNKYLNIIIFLYIIYFFIILLSLYIGAFQYDSKIILRDFYEFHKPILYILIILFIYINYYKDIEDINIRNILYMTFIILLLFSYFQLNYYKNFSSLYIDDIIYNSNRLTAPFGNPYDYAFVMIFFCFYFFYKYIFFGIKFIIPLILSIWMVLETGSKSNTFAFLLIFIFICPILILFSDLKFKKKLLYIFQLLLIPLIFFLLNIFDFILNNYSMIFHQFSQFYYDGNIGNSAEVRIDQLLIVLQRAIDHPSLFLFGNGPAKGLELGFYRDGNPFYSEHLESAVTYIFFRYGLLGMVIFPAIYFYIVSLLLNNNKNLKKLDEIKIFNLSMLTWFFFIPISSIGGMFMEQPRVSFFFYLLIGLSLIINKNLKNAK